MLLRIFSRMSRTRHASPTTKVNKRGIEPGFNPPSGKGSLCACSLYQEKTLCYKKINASRENTSSIDVHEEKPGEREREDAEITWEEGRGVIELGVLGLEA